MNSACLFYTNELVDSYARKVIAVNNCISFIFVNHMISHITIYEYVIVSSDL